MFRKKVIFKLFAVVVVASVATTTLSPMFVERAVVHADEGDYQVYNGMVDLGRGSASITIRGNVGHSLIGKRFEVIKLFNAENAEHSESINYTFNPLYENAVKTVVAEAINNRDNSNLKPEDVTEYIAIDYIQTLNNNQIEGCFSNQALEGRYSAFRYFVEDIRNEIKRESLNGDIFYINSTLATNTVQLCGLSYGYYLVDEISEHDSEGNDWYASSLCAVSTSNPSATVQIKSDYPTIVKKIQEDDKIDTVGNEGWNDIADYEIGQTIPYKYESTIPDMNGYHAYYYAWHDSMDEELTFHDDKDEISIVISKGKKDYKVKDSEYEVITTGTSLDTGDTFKLEIKDIKKIIDREFNNIDSLGHNDYSNITVKVEYYATLNDKAADNTGRAGFENDVRLEFSNDPDQVSIGNSGDIDVPSTGYTPWDTTVCFTYKMNGLKTNDHDRPLSKAKFRLYYDEDCTEEVYVKVKETGVEVIPPEEVDNTNTSEETPEEVENTSTSEETKGLGNLFETAKKGMTSSGVTENVTNPTDEETVGNNGYIVINRDSCEEDEVPEEAVEITSDADGNFTIYGLDQGTYYLKEVKAPAGYRPLLDLVIIVVRPIFTSDRNNYIAGSGAGEDVLKGLEATGHITEFYDGQYKDGDAVLVTDVEDGSFNIKIINEVGSKLPVTGSSATLILVGAGVLLIGVAVFVKVKERKKDTQ